MQDVGLFKSYLSGQSPAMIIGHTSQTDRKHNKGDFDATIRSVLNQINQLEDFEITI